MLSIGRLGPDAAGYYCSQVAAGREDYYIGAGEAPGTWVGSGIANLGLGGVVGEDEFRRVLAGCHPHTGTPLVTVSDGRLAGLDLTFSAPKSVSLIWALHPDPRVRSVVADAHDRAIGDAIRFLESDAVRARRGHNGIERVKVAGLVAAGFGHRTSRAGDPQLHTHLVASNLVQDSTGRWSALDSRAIYRHARTAGFIYQARLRAELSAHLGVEWGPVRNGQADLIGVPRNLIDGFSTRRTEILEALERRGLSSANAARVATLDTRPAKAAEEPTGLFEAWRAQAEAAGVDLAGVTGRVTGVEWPKDVVERLCSPVGLTAQASSFDRRDLLRALAGEHQGGATLERLEALAAQVTDAGATVELTATDADVSMRRWTTVDLLATEGDLLAIADRSADRDAGGARSGAVEQAIAERPQLSEEQRQLVRGVCGSPAGVVVVVGKAGAGKTFALDACRAAWAADHVPVIGAALAARAAAELQAGSGIPSVTLARLVADIDDPRSRPEPGSVIVVDEAGMVGTRELHRLAASADRYDWRLVLVGDPRQLPEIDAGGGFAHLVGRVPTWRLETNRRQVEGWERAALDRLREHRPSPALAAYQTAGRVTVTATAGERVERMAADWHEASVRGVDAVMLATRRTEVDALNSAAQGLRVSAGELDPAIRVEVAGRLFMVGDRVMCTRNDRKHSLVNGTRLTITDIQPGQSIIAAETDGLCREIPWVYVEQGHLTLGYATTVHKAQGMTTDEAFLLGDDRLFAEAGYVGLSRGRQSNRLYVVAQPDPGRVLEPHGEIDHIVAALGVSKAQTLSTVNMAGEGVEPVRPLGALVAERDRILEAVLADMPPDPTARLESLAESRRALAEQPADVPWLSTQLADLERKARQAAVELRDRHDWAARHRHDGQQLAAITAAIDQRLAVIAQAVDAGPDPHLVGLLGPQPDDRAARRAWVEAATRVEAWREITGKPANTLLDNTAGRDLGDGWWARARHALTRQVENQNTIRHGQGI
ncbi:MAG TPA: MobF family relaxase [Acidimicrobiales bacterium]|nr:MobF family relaxase [Acidimicrobiales bacterium]